MKVAFWVFYVILSALSGAVLELNHNTLWGWALFVLLLVAFHRIPEDSDLYDEADRKLSDIMHAYWVNFARTGDPNGPGLPVFEQNAGSEMIMELGDNVGMIKEPYLAFYGIMDGKQGFDL